METALLSREPNFTSRNYHAANKNSSLNKKSFLNIKKSTRERKEKENRGLQEKRGEIDDNYVKKELLRH